MDFDYQIIKTLKEYGDELYEMIELKIVFEGVVMEHRALPLGLRVTDGNYIVDAFIVNLSSNQKELLTYFTVDAFDIFSGNVNIQFGYLGEYSYTILDVDVLNIAPLSNFLSNIPHIIANNDWLQTIISAQS